MDIANMKMDKIFGWLPHKWLDGILLSNAAAITILDYIERYKGAMSFVILFAVTISVKAIKAWQEYRHTERRTAQELRQDEERHKIELQAATEEFKRKYLKE